MWATVDEWLRCTDSTDDWQGRRALSAAADLREYARGLEEQLRISQESLRETQEQLEALRSALYYEYRSRHPQDLVLGGGPRMIRLTHGRIDLRR